MADDKVKENEGFKMNSKEDEVDREEDKSIDKMVKKRMYIAYFLVSLGLILSFFALYFWANSLYAEINVLHKFIKAGKIDSYLPLLPEDKFETLAWGQVGKVTPAEGEIRILTIGDVKYYFFTLGGEQYLFNSSLTEVKPNKKAQFWEVVNKTKAKRILFYVDIDVKPELIVINDRNAIFKLLARGNLNPEKSFDKAVDSFIKSLEKKYPLKQKKS